MNRVQCELSSKSWNFPKAYIIPCNQLIDYCNVYYSVIDIENSKHISSFTSTSQFQNEAFHKLNVRIPWFFSNYCLNELQHIFLDLWWYHIPKPNIESFLVTFELTNLLFDINKINWIWQMPIHLDDAITLRFCLNWWN